MDTSHPCETRWLAPEVAAAPPVVKDGAARKTGFKRPIKHHEMKKRVAFQSSVEAVKVVFTLLWSAGR